MSEDTRMEITLHSTRLNRDFPVCVYRTGSGDFVVMHRSLREVFDSMEPDAKPIEKAPVQLDIPANDTSTLWVFRQDLVFGNGSVIWGIGSISKNEMAARPNLIRDMFRPDIAVNRAFDNAVLRWLGFELKSGDDIVRWFYGSESMDMRDAIPVTERNLSMVMANAGPAGFSAPDSAPGGVQAPQAQVFRNGADSGFEYRPVNQTMTTPAPQPMSGFTPRAGEQAPVQNRTSQPQPMPGFTPPAGAQASVQGRVPAQAPVPAQTANTAPAPAGSTNRAPVYRVPAPDVLRVYFDLSRMQTRVETSLGTLWYSPDTRQWTGDTLNPASIDIGKVTLEASRLLGMDISEYRGNAG